MLAFDVLLAYLDPSDVREIVLESGVPPSARTDAGARVLNPDRLTPRDVERLCAGTALAQLLAEAREIGVALGAFERGGNRYPAQVEVDGSRIVVRIARDRTRARGKGLAATQPSELPPTPRRSGKPTAKPTAAHMMGMAPKRQDEPRSSRPPQSQRGRDDVRNSARPPSSTRPSSSKAPSSLSPPRRSTRPPKRRTSLVPPAPETIRAAATIPPARKVRASALVRAAALADLEALLVLGRKLGASDAHLASNEPAAFRVLERLSTQGAPVAAESVAAIVGALLDDSTRRLLEERGAATLTAELGGAGRVRVTTVPHAGGFACAIRLLPAIAPSAAELGLPDELLKAASASSGLVLIAGGPASGRSTTLAALLEAASARGACSLSLESPVEVLLPRKTGGGVVEQREPGRSLVAAVRAALAADYDVLALGDLSTGEALEAALEACEAGRLVLAAAPGATIARALDRVLELSPPDTEAHGRALLAAHLRVVSAQRLVPSVDGKRAHVAMELATGGGPLAALIREAKLFQLPSLLQRGRAIGMLQLEESLRALVRAGAVSATVARRVSPNLGASAPGRAEG